LPYIYVEGKHLDKERVEVGLAVWQGKSDVE